MLERKRNQLYVRLFYHRVVVHVMLLAQVIPNACDTPALDT